MEQPKEQTSQPQGIRLTDSEIWDVVKPVLDKMASDLKAVGDNFIAGEINHQEFSNRGKTIGEDAERDMYRAIAEAQLARANLQHTEILQGIKAKYEAEITRLTEQVKSLTYELDDLKADYERKGA